MSMVTFEATKYLKDHYHNVRDAVGLIPLWLDTEDPTSAKEQLNNGYQHGGGWRPFQGFKYDEDEMTLKYPGDPKYHALAIAHLHNETIIIFPHAWVMVLQDDGKHEICRMD